MYQEHDWCHVYGSMKSQEMRMTHGKMNICESELGSTHILYYFAIQSPKSLRVTKVIILIVV